MNAFPLPAIVAALAAVAALPFSAAAAGTLFLAAGLGSVIHADYVQRHQRLRLPRLAAPKPHTDLCPELCCEPNQLAA